MSYEVTFWGTRGSIPTPGPRTARFGGNTPCLSLSRGNGHLVVLDAGTAARVAGELGAQYAVTGSFVDHFGRLRVNAQLVDVRRGAIVRAFTNDDPSLQRREDLPEIVHLQAERIAQAVTLPGKE